MVRFASFIFIVFFVLSFSIFLLAVESGQIFGQVPSSNTYYVDAQNGNDLNNGKSASKGRGTSGPWKTLDKANETVAPGDTVYLIGTFQPYNKISPLVSGTKDALITFKSYSTQRAAIDSSSGNELVVLQDKNYIVIDGIDFINSKFGPIRTGGPSSPWTGKTFSPGFHGIKIQRSNFITIKNSLLHHIGIYIVNNSSDNTIENNTIKEVVGYDDYGNMIAAGSGVQIEDGSHRNIIRNNTVSFMGHHGIGIGGAQYKGYYDTPQDLRLAEDSLNNRIENNKVSNAWGIPIYLSPGANQTIVEYNDLSDGGTSGLIKEILPGRPGIDIRADNNTVRYNKIYNNSYGGIHIDAYISGFFNPNRESEKDYVISSRNNQIYHNVIYNNRNHGLYIYWRKFKDAMTSVQPEIANNLVANNIFYNNDGWIPTSGYPDSNIPKTIVISNYGETSLNWSEGSLNGNKILNNIFLRKNGTPQEKSIIIARSGANPMPTLSLSLSEFENVYAGQAANNLEVNPLFINESLLDFHLSSQSPAIDKGNTIVGMPYKGIAPDIGIYEYQLTSPTPPICSSRVGTCATPTPTVFSITPTLQITPSVTITKTPTPTATCIGIRCM